MGCIFAGIKREYADSLDYGSSNDRVRSLISPAIIKVLRENMRALIFGLVIFLLLPAAFFIIQAKQGALKKKGDAIPLTGEPDVAAG